MKAMLEVQDLRQRFELGQDFLDRLRLERGRLRYRRAYVHAVNGVSFSIRKGEVLGLVGESGCGKSTVAKTVIRLLEPQDGRILLEGTDITHLRSRELVPLRRRMQMIYQDPYSSLNPRQRVQDLVAEPILFHGLASGRREAREMALEALERVGLSREQGRRYPHQFSGGQRQRIGIARALSIRPELIIADEPVSALDVSIQAQILNLMMDLKEEFGFSYLFIAHDISVVHYVADRVGVMYLGFLVEVGGNQAVVTRPLHPYTRYLMSCTPALGQRHFEETLEVRGEVPSAIQLPSGCCFRTRCPFAFSRCTENRPELVEVEPGHKAACHLAGRS
jgi:oligopeptide/dipeptide ABC transporter ATP-binding protein